MLSHDLYVQAVAFSRNSAGYFVGICVFPQRPQREPPPAHPSWPRSPPVPPRLRPRPPALLARPCSASLRRGGAAIKAARTAPIGPSGPARGQNGGCCRRWCRPGSGRAIPPVSAPSRPWRLPGSAPAVPRPLREATRVPFRGSAAAGTVGGRGLALGTPAGACFAPGGAGGWGGLPGPVVGFAVPFFL